MIVPNLPRYREAIAIAICDATSGGEGPRGLPGKDCECTVGGATVCPDMLRAADAAIAVLVGHAKERS